MTQGLAPLLTIPTFARDIALPDDWNVLIADAIIHIGEDDDASKQTASTARQLQHIRQNLADSPISFYPFDGADALYPTLLSHAKVTILIGVEPWGG